MLTYIVTPFFSVTNYVCFGLLMAVRVIRLFKCFDKVTLMSRAMFFKEFKSNLLNTLTP